MNIGYGHISTDDQKPDQQYDGLQNAGYIKIFKDVASGGLILGTLIGGTDMILVSDWGKL
jgi:hypothetical protein